MTPDEPIPAVMPAPHCPHCDAELVGMGLFNWQQGNWIILCAYCSDCLKIIHTAILPTMMDAAIPSPPAAA
jgi:hypothetical protein